MRFDIDSSGRPCVPLSFLLQANQLPPPGGPLRTSGNTASPGLWSRFNFFIATIGNAMARSWDYLSQLFYKLVFAIIVIGALYYIWMGLTTYDGAYIAVAVIVAIILGFVFFFAASLAGWLLIFPLTLIRLIFWNGTSFVSALVITATVTCIVLQR